MKSCPNCGCKSDEPDEFDRKTFMSKLHGDQVSFTFTGAKVAGPETVKLLMDELNKKIKKSEHI